MSCEQQEAEPGVFMDSSGRVVFKTTRVAADLVLFSPDFPGKRVTS